jgi:hypothetical protein
MEDEMNLNSPYLKNKIKEQMLYPMLKCEFRQAYCRFAIPGYCLESYKLFACEYVSKVSDKCQTFDKKGGATSKWLKCSELE